MVLLFQYGVSKQGIAGLMDMLMAQGTASTESKSLSLFLASINPTRKRGSSTFPELLYMDQF